MTTLPDIARAVGATLPRAMSRFAAHAFRLRGRASRSEYWWWMLVNIVVLAITQFALPALIEGKTPQPTLYLGPFGSCLFAAIDLFTTSQTDAPASALAVFSLIVAGVWMFVTDKRLPSPAPPRARLPR